MKTGGKGGCAVSCIPSQNGCPAPMKSQMVNMSFDTPGGKTVKAVGGSYCLP